MIVQAIPGSGKTFLARSRDRVVDSDDLLAALFGVKGKAGYDSVLADFKMMDQLREAIYTFDKAGATVVCNFDPADVFARVDARFSYTPLGYVRHLKLVGRSDLLTKFSEPVLTDWARDYEGKRRVYWLLPGQFLAEAL